MFEALVLAHDTSLAAAIEQLAAETREVAVLRTARPDISDYEVARLLNTFQPDLVFLEIGNDVAALSLAEALISHDPDLAIIGLSGPWIQKLAPHLSDSGFSAILPLPLTVEGFQETVKQAIHRVHSSTMDNLICFMPAKAGCGASTVALNMAGAVAASGRQKVLLIEADLHSGPVAELIRVKPQISTRDVLANSAHLDSHYWRSAVVPFEGVDILLTDRARKQPVPGWIDYFHLLQFVRSRYQLVVVDLPEIVNDATAEVVRRAREVHVVTTPDIPPVCLAKQRIAELESRQVPGERMRIVVNRWHKTDLTADEMAKEINAPVAAVLQNDFPVVRRSTIGGSLIGAATRLGRQYDAFAKSVMGIQPIPVRRASLLQILTSWI